MVSLECSVAAAAGALAAVTILKPKAVAVGGARAAYHISKLSIKAAPKLAKVAGKPLGRLALRGVRLGGRVVRSNPITAGIVAAATIINHTDVLDNTIDAIGDFWTDKLDLIPNSATFHTQFGDIDFSPRKIAGGVLNTGKALQKWQVGNLEKVASIIGF